MAHSNTDKSLHGRNALNSLFTVLTQCQERQLILSVTKDYRIGKSGFHNKKQFYAPFLITLTNGEQWVLFSTTSMRTDRIKGQQWDASNLKSINSKISMALLIYADGLPQKEEVEFKKQREKYISLKEFSAIDDIVSQEELVHLIELKSTVNMSAGRQKDLQGHNFEDRVSFVLSDKSNLLKWQLDDKLISGTHYNLFETIVTGLRLDPNETLSIHATSDVQKIGKLPTRGNPKTDVLISVCTRQNSTEYYTLSCKRSSKTRVSVHEYTYQAFSDVLDPNNKELKDLLALFQKNPTLSAFGPENCQKLTSLIAPYRQRLAEWVLGGIGGLGNPTTQWASHIVTYNNTTFKCTIHSVREYIAKLHQSHKKGNFGTDFSWTYPSKKRGKSIQLKCSIVD